MMTKRETVRSPDLRAREGCRQVKIEAYALIAAVVALAGIPERILFSPRRPMCLFHRVLGLSCPGCGLTRALHQLSRFRIRKSFNLHLGAAPVLVHIFSRVALLSGCKKTWVFVLDRWSKRLVSVALLAQVLRGVTLNKRSN